MIGHLTGTLISFREQKAVIDVSGVGYNVTVSAHTFGKLDTKPGADISLFTHLAVRENSLEIFGFAEEEELSFFELLIGVSGIGPRSAIAILAIAEVKTLRRAISENDSTYLTKVSGIGKKNAQKIILELKDKIEKSDENVSGLLSHDIDTLEALKTLGYSTQEARHVIKKIPREIEGSQDRLKEALKILGS